LKNLWELNVFRGVSVAVASTLLIDHRGAWASLNRSRSREIDISHNLGSTTLTCAHLLSLATLATYLTAKSPRPRHSCHNSRRTQDLYAISWSRCLPVSTQNRSNRWSSTLLTRSHPARRSILGNSFSSSKMVPKSSSTRETTRCC
jgi:hypothetical protein